MKTKHRCGLTPAYSGALKPYPVTDCVGCSNTRERGDMPEGPTVVERKRVGKKEPSKGTKPHGGNRAEAIEKKATRAELVKRKQRRKMLIIAAVSHGVDTAAELMKVMERFDVELKRRTLYNDLASLVRDKWLAKEKVDRETAHGWQEPWQWSYSINPAITERFTDG